MSETPDQSAVPPTEPPQPARVRTQIEPTAEGLSLVFRKRQLLLGCFMSGFFLFWSAGCITLTIAVIASPELTMVLFALPFWAAWMFLLVAICSALFLRDRLTLDSAGIRLRRRVLFFSKQQFVPLAEAQSFSSYYEETDSESGTGEWGLELKTLGLPLQFFGGLEEGERAWLQFKLNELLRELQGKYLHTSTRKTRRPADPAQAPVEMEMGADGEREAQRLTETLQVASAPVEAPSDSRWGRLQTYEAITFENRGHLSGTGIAGVLFLNAFWNGIVGVFLSVLISGEGLDGDGELGWWFLFLFLIPFELIGLVLLVGLVFAILEPFRRTTWQFQRGMIIRRMSWFGLGKSWRSPVEQLDSIQLRCGDRSEIQSKKLAKPYFKLDQNQSHEAPYRLAFVNTAGEDVCEIENLTEGEARWMADVVYRELERLFR